LNFHENDNHGDGSGIMNALSLSILGALLGHPAMGRFDTGSGGELEELDNAFDDSAYMRDWRPWEWEPGLCVNCCHKVNSNECDQCGWLQGAA
jgi:hypothetical protein